MQKPGASAHRFGGNCAGLRFDAVGWHRRSRGFAPRFACRQIPLAERTADAVASYAADTLPSKLTRNAARINLSFKLDLSDGQRVDCIGLRHASQRRA